MSEPFRLHRSPPTRERLEEIKALRDRVGLRPDTDAWREVYDALGDLLSSNLVLAQTPSEAHEADGEYVICALYGALKMLVAATEDSDNIYECGVSAHDTVMEAARAALRLAEKNT